MTATTASPLARLRTRATSLARGGTASVVAGSAYSNVLRIVSSMTLTRLLAPEAFGVVGVVMSVSVILTMLSDVGLYPFIIRHDQGNDTKFLDEVWTLRLGRSAVLTIAMAVAAWPAAAFMGKPVLAPVLAVYSLSFMIEGCSSLAFATAVREGKLWRLTLLEALTATIQLVFAVAFALLFRSSWTLVIAMLASAAVRSILSYAMFPGSTRRFAPDRARARELWAFSRVIAVSSFLSLLTLQADKLVLAQLMPLADYGHYVIAATLATAPIPLATGYAQRVLYPAYADAFRRGGAAALAGIFYAKRRSVTLLYMLAVGGLCGGAALLVRLLYDSRYADVAPLLGLLAISSTIYLPAVTADEALVAAGRVRWTFYATVARVVWLAAGGAIALLLHDTVMLVAVVGVMEVMAILCYWLGLHRLGVLKVGEEALGIAAALTGAALGYGLTLVAAAMLPGL